MSTSSSELEAVRAELVALRELVLRAQTERPRLYSLSDAARLLGVSTKTVKRMIWAGELMPTLIRSRQMICVTEIDRVSAPPQAKSSGATPERTRFDGAKALAELRALRGKQKR